jgi:hypothetical protein
MKVNWIIILQKKGNTKGREREPGLAACGAIIYREQQKFQIRSQPTSAVNYR